MKVKCPVCQMVFGEDRIAAQAEHDGVVYYFCTLACRKQFLDDPTRYVT